MTIKNITRLSNEFSKTVGVYWILVPTQANAQCNLFQMVKYHYISFMCVVWVCNVLYLHVGTGLWQVTPAQPLAQTQENWFTSLTHVPPFRQGEDAHSLMSEGKKILRLCLNSVQRYTHVCNSIALMLEHHRTLHNDICMCVETYEKIREQMS